MGVMRCLACSAEAEAPCGRGDLPHDGIKNDRYTVTAGKSDKAPGAAAK